MFQSNGLFKCIDCPFFKHDLCHRPYCHFKHIKPKKEKDKAKGVTDNAADTEVRDGSVVDENAKKTTVVERPPSPIDDVNEEILKIISKYKSRQESPSPIDEVNDEILKIVMKYKSHEETHTSPIDEVNDEILKIVMKYKKSKQQETSSSSADIVTDDILNIVKNISPSKLIEYAKRKQEVEELQKVLDQVDEESKESSVVVVSSEESAGKRITPPQQQQQHGILTKSVRSDEEMKRGLVDSFYSKAKVEVNITSGDLDVTKPNTSSSSLKEKIQPAAAKKKTICNCDDPECSGFREEGVDAAGHFMHTSVNVNDIQDEYMRRKMQRRLQRKKKILTQSKTFCSVLPGTDEQFTSLQPAYDEAFPSILPGNDEMSSSDLPSKTIETSTSVVVPTENITIREADFFVAPTHTPLVDEEPDEGHIDDLSKYIDKCKAEYAKKRMGKSSPMKSSLSTDNVMESKSSNVASNDSVTEKDAVVDAVNTAYEDIKILHSLCSSDNEPKVGVQKTLSDINPDTKKHGDGDNEGDDDAKRESSANKSQNFDVGIKKKRLKNDEDGKSSASSVVQVKKKRRIILPVEECATTASSIVVEGGKRKEETKKHKVTFADEKGCSNPQVNTNNKCDNSKTKVVKGDVKDNAKSDNKTKGDVKGDLKGDNKTKGDMKGINKTKGEKVKSDEKHVVKVDTECKDKKCERDDSLKKSEKVLNCNKYNDLDKSGKKDSEKKVKTTNKEDGKKYKTIVENESDDKHSKNISDGKTKSSGSEKRKKEEENDMKSDTTLNYFDTHERDNSCRKPKVDKRHNNNETVNSNVNPTTDNTVKLVKTKDSKKRDELSNNLTKVGKIMENTSKENKINTDKDISTEVKKKRRESDSESRNVFDVIAISSSDDEQSDVSPTDIHVSEEQFFSDDDISNNIEKLASVKEDITLPPAEAKKRKALTTEVIHRKPVQPHKPKSMKMSYVSPGLKATSAVINNSTSSSNSNKNQQPSTSVNQSTKTCENVYSTGKKRVSHVKPASPVPQKEVDNRPKLEMDIGGKIPHVLRQKYFDKIIDELIPKLPTKQEAYEKAIADELDAYKRSSRKPLYMNLCANIVKRIRSMPNYIAPKEKPKAADPMKTAQTTTKSIRSDAMKKMEAKGTPKDCIKPASAVVSKRERSNSLSLEPLELTEDNFYDHLQQYMLTQEQLWEHKYPRRDPENKELAVIRDYVPSSNTLKRLCCRCGKEYFMNKKGKYVTRNECHYHWGKLLRQRGRNSAMAFTCCGADANGATCAMCRLHVSNKVGPLINYVSTDSCVNNDSKRKVFALDCEMCYTTQGLELTRLTVIDFDLEQIIDLFIKPTNPIVDYNTRFSGVTREDLQDVTTTISDIHDILLNMLDKDTILIGHSLESDLNALNIIHEKVVDTSIVFPHRMGLPLKRALRNLMVEYLQKVIQSGVGGHDSCEDARSCMELMKYKFKEDQKLRKRLKLSSSNV